MGKLTCWIAVAIVSAGLVPLTGCRICADCEDLAYPAYGGAWERTRRDAGRVGSVFDPAGGKADDLVDRDQPPSPDELERQREESAANQATSPDRRDGDSIESNSDLPAPESPDQGPGDQGTGDQGPGDRKLDGTQDPKDENPPPRQLDKIDIHYVPKSQPSSIR